MIALRVCERCGGPLTESAGGDICPGCIAQLGQAPWLAEPAAEAAAPLESESPLRNPKPEIQNPRLRHFGDYELLEEIAHGGMGVVYKARQVSLNRVVAVKMIRAGILASDTDIRRFRAEAEAAAALQHSNIVAVHEVGVQEGQHYFSMDYVEGITLARLVREQPLPARRGAQYVTTIAQAIHYAHEQGILHRDLKPSNVLIDANDQPRITDFGLAKRANNETTLTQDGQILGSPSYMPPEQAAGSSRKIGRQSDVYSLGAILYQLLTGKPPYQAETPREVLRQVLELEPVPIHRLNPKIPRDLETICLKCLEKEPARRYANARFLAEDLGRFLNGQSILAQPIGPAGRAWRWCRREPMLAGMAAGIFLLLSTVALLTSSFYHREKMSRVAAEQESAHNLKALVDRIERDRSRGDSALHVSAEELNLLTHRRLLTDSTEKRITLAACTRQQVPDRMVMPFGQLVQQMQSHLRDQAQLAVLFDLRLYFSQADAETGLLTDSPELFRADPAVYVLARQRIARLTPMVQEVCGGKPEIRGALITRTNSDITVLPGLKGRSFAFGEAGSAIGWHVPKAVLVEAGLRSHDFKQITNLPTAQVLTAVRTAVIDAGVVMRDDLENLAKTGVRFRVLHELRTPSSPWVVTGKLDTNTVAALRAALLSLRDAQILARLNYDLTGFVPTRPENYDVLERQIEKARKFDVPAIH